jgi:branched-chain amino acid transport system substrate-binding protein
VALMAIVLVGTACAPGGDEGNGGADEQGEIVVAAAMPLTGPYASDGEEMQQALEMAIDEYNAEGGLLGRKLTLVTCDVGALEVDTIQACAERLLGEDPDAVITGYDDSGVSTLAFGEGEMPYLHCNAMRAAIEPVMDDPEKYGNAFQYCPSDYDYGVNAAEMLLQIAERIGFTPTNQTVAAITTDYAYNVLGADTFIETIEQQGYDLALKEVIPFGIQEFGPILSKIEDAEPAFVTFWDLDPSDAARFMQQWVRQFGDTGINSLLYMQYTPNIPEFLELAGEGANGLLWATVIGISDEIGLAKDDYVQRWVERHGRDPLSVYAYITRDAFDIWAQAVEEAECVRCFDRVIGNIRSIEYTGFGGVYRFAPPEQGQYAMPGDELVPTIWSQVQAGEHVVVLPDVAAEGTLQMPPWVP